MNIQRYVNSIDEIARTQMTGLANAVREEQQRMFIGLMALYMQNGNFIENAQRVIHTLEGVDMGFVHNFAKSMKNVKEHHARLMGVVPTISPALPTPKRDKKPADVV